MSRLVPPLVLALLAALLPACGSAQNRPVVLATLPANGADVPGTLAEIRVTFDDPVSILNATQVVVVTDGVTIAVVSSEDPDDPHTLVIRPQLGWWFLNGSGVVRLRAGWEVNEDGHYRLEDYRFTFTLGADLPIYFGVPSPASVVQANASDLTPAATVPTPGTRVPVGLTCSTVVADQRTWVQLASGGGLGESLAWFRPGDAVMASVALTHEPGGDLVADRPAVQVDGAGGFLYAAFRDVALGRVRVHKVDLTTATEVSSLLLSPAASPSTSPQGLALIPENEVLHVACAADAGARLAVVDLATFTEVDVGPDLGVDGMLLPAGAGPVAGKNDVSLVAPLAETTAALTRADPTTSVVDQLASIVTGAPTSILFTPDRRWGIVGLRGWVDGEAFSYRNLYAVSTTEEPVVVDESTGAGNGAATEVLDVAWITGSNLLIALLDNDAAVYLRFQSSGIFQEDPYEDAPAPAVDLSGVAPGATLVATPPPAVAPTP